MKEAQGHLEPLEVVSHSTFTELPLSPAILLRIFIIIIFIKFFLWFDNLELSVSSHLKPKYLNLSFTNQFKVNK